MTATDAPAPAVALAHPLVAAVDAAAEQARTCATIKAPKAMLRLAARLAALGQSVLAHSANPATFSRVYAIEWQPMKGITRFPTLYGAMIALNAAVAACQPSAHPGQLPAFGAALAARRKICDQTMPTMPMAVDVGCVHLWTDGAIFVLPQEAAVLRQTAKNQGANAEAARESMRDKLMAVRDWLVEQRMPEDGPADIYLGREWSDGPLRVLVAQGRWAQAYDPAAVAILRGCGATHVRLVDQSTMRRADGTHPAKRHDTPPVLVGFRGVEPVGFCMPLTGNWLPTLARWRGCNAVITYRGVAL